jgi:hypothetical protein
MPEILTGARALALLREIVTARRADLVRVDLCAAVLVRHGWSRRTADTLAARLVDHACGDGPAVAEVDVDAAEILDAVRTVRNLTGSIVRAWGAAERTAVERGVLDPHPPAGWLARRLDRRRDQILRLRLMAHAVRQAEANGDVVRAAYATPDEIVIYVDDPRGDW